MSLLVPPSEILDSPPTSISCNCISCTSCPIMQLTYSHTYVGGNLKLMAYFCLELYIFKPVKLDVWGSLVLSNPVTCLHDSYIKYQNLLFVDLQMNHYHQEFIIVFIMNSCYHGLKGILLNINIGTMK